MTGRFPGQGGFTLMEVLLATTLATLAALAAAGVLRMGMDFYDRSRVLLVENDGVRAGLRVARTELSGVIIGSALPFAGREDEVEFTTASFPRGAGIRGMKRVRLACRQRQAGEGFVLTHQLVPEPLPEVPAGSATTTPAPPGPYDEELDLVDRLATCAFAYLRVAEKKGTWITDWEPVRGGAPLAVRLHLQTDRQDFPPVVLPVPRP